jgi:hypothetical protein
VYRFYRLLSGMFGCSLDLDFSNILSVPSFSFARFASVTVNFILRVEWVGW